MFASSCSFKIICLCCLIEHFNWRSKILIIVTVLSSFVSQAVFTPIPLKTLKSTVTVGPSIMPAYLQQHYYHLSGLHIYSNIVAFYQFCIFTATLLPFTRSAYLQKHYCLLPGLHIYSSITAFYQVCISTVTLLPFTRSAYLQQHYCLLPGLHIYSTITKFFHTQIICRSV